ncbi:hypothetical protein C8R43DRAFT_948163 [Mycena crocata]|nr:hypothetical protein C8R43DRAFT_948163 [Mycena crocata]
MPSQLTSTQVRLNNAISAFTGAANTLEILAQSFKTPFLEPISRMAHSLLDALQHVKQNKGDCSQLIEQTYRLLYAIVSSHINSSTATGPDLPPSLLNHLGRFTNTLYKIHTYVEAQQDKSTIRKFFRHGEMSTLLKACHNGIEEALDVITMQNVNLLADIEDLQKYAEDRHEEVLQFIEIFSEGSSADTSSLVKPQKFPIVLNYLMIIKFNLNLHAPI